MKSTFKIEVFFRQIGEGLHPWSLSKTISLSAIPVPGSYFLYQNGWGCAEVVSTGERGLHLYILPDCISIDGYGPRFTATEAESLRRLGWKDSKEQD